MATQPLPLEQDDAAHADTQAQNQPDERLRKLWDSFVESLWVLRVYGVPAVCLTLLLTLFIMTSQLAVRNLDALTDDILQENAVLLAQSAEHNPHFAPTAADMSARVVIDLVQEAMLRGYDFKDIPFNHDYDFKVARLGTQWRSSWMLNADRQFARDARMMPGLDNIMTGREPAAGAFRNQQVEMAVDYDSALRAMLEDADFALSYPDLQEAAVQAAPGWNAFMARGELSGWLMVGRSVAQWFRMIGKAEGDELADALSTSADIMADAMLQGAAEICMREAPHFQQLMMDAFAMEGSIPGDRTGQFVMGVPPGLQIFTNIERYGDAMTEQTEAARERASHIAELAQAWCDGLYRDYRPS